MVRALRWAGIAVSGLVALVVVLMLGLNTQPGRRFVADRLAGFSTASGLNFRAGRIDGSIYGRMVLRNVQIRDAAGVFARVPEMTLDWRPFAYLRSRIEVRELIAPRAELIRSPRFKPTPTDPNAPLLPDIDLTLGRLEIGRLTIRPAVTGRRHIVILKGSAQIAGGRAQINLDAGALRGVGVAGGDTLHVMLDAVPDANRFGLQARLSAPAGGLVDSYAGLGKALAVSVGGQGDWTNWHGRIQANAAGAPLATIEVTGRNGTFDTRGQVRPGLLLSGAALRLVEPAIQLHLVTALDRRKADIRLEASSRAFAAKVAGLIDLGANRFGDLQIEAKLLETSAIAPNVEAKAARALIHLDGTFGSPDLRYRVTAHAIDFGGVRVTGLDVVGEGRIDTTRLKIPVHASAGAVTGVSAAGGLLTRLRVDGDIAYQDGKVATDNLRVRSDRIDATAILLADIAKGTYTGALKGRVNDYQVNGLGRINLVTDARLVPGLNDGFALRGHVRAVTRRLDNTTLRDELGGNALVDADVGYDLAGGATLTNLRLRAPKFRITSGDGFYRPDGRIAFHVSGASANYGPLAVDVSGTLARPVAKLRADRPGLGVGLKGIEATLEGSPRGYRIRGRGQSDYGPLAADAMIVIGEGPLAADIANISFAGLSLSGRIVQRPSGPFDGTLRLAGSGLTGTARLGAESAVQRIDLDARASSARLPGPVPIAIGSGSLTAAVLLPPQGPTVTGKFAVADARYGALLATRAQGRIDYRGGKGSAALIANGSQSGMPFDLATQASLSPTRIVANLKGRFNGIAVSLAAPAVATKVGMNWQLAPTTLVVPQGRMDVSGSFGSVTSGHARLSSLDIGIVNAFAPGLGLDGKASGTIDYVSRGIVPDVRARIDVTGFTRTASLTVSDPVDIALLATLNGNGGSVAALMRRGGETLGRLQAKLAPLGRGASLSERIVAAPLSGGIRYNGPAEALWAMTGVARQEVSGPIAIGADFGGRLNSPTLNGVLRANALRYENETYGTVFSSIVLDGHFTQTELLLNRFSANAGSGTIQASGRVGLDAAGGFPINLSARLDRARLARGDGLDATVSGTLVVTNTKAEGGLIKGDLTVPEARYAIVREGAAAVPELTGVHRKGITPVAANDMTALPGSWKLDVRLRAANRIFVSGMGLEAEWRTNMQVSGTTTAPRVTGRLEVVRGTYSFAGRRFELDRGRINFQGGQLNPALDIAASTSVEGVSATISIGGTAERPQISFTSTPALPQDEVLSRLLFGSSVTSLSPTQAIQLAAALNSLRSSGGGLNPLGKLRGVAGVDRLRVLGADQSAGRGTSLAAGKYISNNIYVEIITDARGFTATQLEISLSRALSVLSQTGSFGGSNVSVRYKKTY